MIKSPKVYFIDPNITRFLCEYYDENPLKLTKKAGAIFESLVSLHLTVLCEMMVPKVQIFYWRTISWKEVDFVLEYGTKLIAIEVKFSDTVNYRDAGGIRAFVEEYSRNSCGNYLLFR